MKTIQDKALDILDSDGVHLKIRTNTLIIFQVRQSNGSWCTVSRRLNRKNDNFEWACDAVTNRRKTGTDKWGCVFNIRSDKKKPFCSHSFAAHLFLEKIEVSNGKD